MLILSVSPYDLVFFLPFLVLHGWSFVTSSDAFEILIFWLLKRKKDKDLLRYLLVRDFMTWPFLFQVFLASWYFLITSSDSYEKLSSWWEKDYLWIVHFILICSLLFGQSLSKTFFIYVDASWFIEFDIWHK
jgi:hypothetical protein